MIVRDQGEAGWRVVHQVEHARASAALAQRWRPVDSLNDAAWRHLLVATRVHDDGWLDAERSPILNDQGEPVDFKAMPVRAHAAIWWRSIDLAGQHHPLVALLVAMHARYLYVKYPDHDPTDADQVQAFVDQLTECIDRLLAQGAAGGLDAAGLRQLQQLLTFFDGLTLQLLEAVGGLGNDEALPFGLQREVVNFTRQGDELIVAPWPFQGESFAVHVDATLLPRQRYDQPGELAAALAKAPTRRMTWHLTPLAGGCG